MITTITQGKEIEYFQWYEFNADDVIIVENQQKFIRVSKLVVYKDDRIVFAKSLPDKLIVEPQEDGTYRLHIKITHPVSLERFNVLTHPAGMFFADIGNDFEEYAWTPGYNPPVYITHHEQWVINAKDVIHRFYDTREKPVETELRIFYRLIIWHKEDGGWRLDDLDSVWRDKLPRREMPKVFP